VLPFYPRNGADWARYVRAGTDLLGGSDRACSTRTGGAREACLHAGEHRVFVVPGVLTSNEASATDAWDVFNWECNEDMQPVRMISTGLAPGRRLADLLEFSTPAFLPSHLTVSHGFGETQSDSTVWWSNPVVAAADGGALTGAGTVYVTSTAEPMEPFSITNRQGVSLVVDPAVTLTRAITPGEALIALDGAGFAWIEGDLDASGASYGVKVDRSAWPVLNGLGVHAADTPASVPFARSGIAAIAIDRSRNALLREIEVGDVGNDDATVDAGIALYRTTGSRFWDVRASNSEGHGVRLSRSSANRLEALIVSNSAGDGVLLDDGASDNVLSEIVTSNNLGDGVVVEGRSDGNRLLQILSRHNAGSGVYMGDALGNLLLGVTAVDNTENGIELVRVQRGVLAAAVVGNNRDGLVLDGTRDYLIRDLASANNAERGVVLAGTSVRNRFRGLLRVGSNGGASDCAIEPGSTGLGSDCAPSDGSDVTLSTGVSLGNAFFGALSGDDAQNPDDSNGVAPFGDITDWVFFGRLWRAWGQGEDFIGPFTRGACGPGDQCRIFDARLVSGDTGDDDEPVLAEVLPAPDAGQLIDHRMRRRERFVAATVELLSDGVGDDDGLCEPDEDCLRLLHIGAFQGRAPLEELGTLANGVELFRHGEPLIPSP
jgi:hypothetical protein